MRSSGALGKLTNSEDRYISNSHTNDKCAIEKHTILHSDKILYLKRGVVKTATKRNQIKLCCLKHSTTTYYRILSNFLNIFVP